MTNQHRRPMVAGNWKMNGTLELVTEFSKMLSETPNIDTVICPPACFINAFTQPSFKLGAQSVSEHEKGAHTGDLSVSMFKQLGVTHVIVGHSERRENHGESNELVGQKVKACVEAGLVPILCVGEPLDVREAGGVFDFVKSQLAAVVDSCGTAFLSSCVIAYEPIWAIGTGKTASPEQAQEVHAYIRSELIKWDANLATGVRLLYGGSVNAENAKTLFAQEDIDGGLIGGASLKIDDFKTICQAAG